MRYSERRHTEAKQRTGHQTKAAKQSKPTQGFLRCRAEAASKHGGAGGLVSPGQGACHVRARSYTALMDGHATLGSLDDVKEVVCTQRFFPSCMWEVNTRV